MDYFSLIVIGLVIYYFLNRNSEDNSKFICSMCGQPGTPKKTVKGNLIFEIILWCLAIIPGLIYSLWRINSKRKECPNCKNVTMIPIDSPIGQRISEENKRREINNNSSDIIQ